MKGFFLTLLGFPLLIAGVFALWQLIHKEPSDTNYVLTPLPDQVKRDTQPAKKPSLDTPDQFDATTTPTTTAPIPTGPLQNQPAPLITYIEITTGCELVLGPTCVTAQARPDASSTVRSRLRIGSVLYVKGIVTGTNGQKWYEIDFPEHLRYPDRLALPWYIPLNAGVPVRTAAPAELTATTSTSSKYIITDRSDQKVYAYDNGTLVRTYTVSTGRELTPTPRGVFTVFRKTPSRYMQGPIPGISTNYYDLPGVPWNLYFTQQGAVVHGAYWHSSFGTPYSNGCVNIDPKEARELYDWAELGMQVIVRD